MKISCVSCNEQMVLENSAPSAESGMTFTFGCSECKKNVEISINSDETGLLKGLNIFAAANEGHQSEPEEVEESASNDDGELVWTQAAEERMESVPVFVRPMAKMGVEKFARDNGISEITPNVMDEAKAKMGM